MKEVRKSYGEVWVKSGKYISRQRKYSAKYLGGQAGLTCKNDRKQMKLRETEQVAITQAM